MFKQITILGAGTMGFSIARLFASHGIKVILTDPNKQVLDKIMHVRNRPTELTCEVDLQQSLKEADLIIEAVPEELEVKANIYLQIASLIKPNAIIASTTSTYPLSALSHRVPFADRMVIMHFFNPAHLIPLVEIVGSEKTSSKMIAEISGLLTRCKKVPIVLKKDLPGFIANRLQAALLREACYILQSGVADAKQIDMAITEGPGMRWAFQGPFQIADAGGLDVWEQVSNQLFPLLSKNTEAPELIKSNLEKGRLGIKSGSGIYEYKGMGTNSQDVKKRDNNLLRLLELKEKK